MPEKEIESEEDLNSINKTLHEGCKIVSLWAMFGVNIYMVFGDSIVCTVEEVLQKLYSKLGELLSHPEDESHDY